jgi:transcription-repair coupling factor (superfamily II helicase)
VFVGLKRIDVGLTPQEFMELRYAGEDKLFVPVERLDLVQKCTGASRPALDRLGGTTWEKAKTRVKKAMRDMAEGCSSSTPRAGRCRALPFRPIRTGSRNSRMRSSGS